MPETELIIFGAGGHGRVVAEVAVQSGSKVAGFVDDNVASCGAAPLALPVLGDRAWLCDLPPNSYRVALGIGENHARKALAQFLNEAGIEVETIISPFAVVSPSAKIGSGTVVMPGAVVNAMAIVGEGVIINTGAVVEHDAKVGNYSHLSSNSTLGGGAEAGELVHIGLGATVLPLICIGSRSILGAGSVATRGVPDDVVAFGAPARTRRSIAAKQEDLPTEHALRG
jgi:sugar O-acyltransferase (sialic acid O-acetyltransferase NeuD family)